jgi:hypothetical protein
MFHRSNSSKEWKRKSHACRILATTDSRHFMKQSCRKRQNSPILPMHEDRLRQGLGESARHRRRKYVLAVMDYGTRKGNTNKKLQFFFSRDTGPAQGTATQAISRKAAAACGRHSSGGESSFTPAFSRSASRVKRKHGSPERRPSREYPHPTAARMADRDSFSDFAEYSIRLFEIMSRKNAISNLNMILIR